MSYRVGYCPCCDSRIMVQDTNGQWNTFKPNFRQADLVFADGSKVRTILCEDCLGETNFQKFIDAITAPDSEACDKKAADFILSKGIPVKLELAVKAKQGVRLDGRS